MTYRVAIRKVSSGETRVHVDPGEWDEERSPWSWVHGNFGCDCNRQLLFGRAHGEEDPDETVCGETEYAIDYVELPDGRRITVDESER